MTLLKMDSLDLKGRVVLIREDFNVPMSVSHEDHPERRITSDVRLHSAIPTIELALKKGAAQILLMSHLGRPEEGVFDPEFSLALVAERLSELLNKKVPLVSNWLDKSKQELTSESKVLLLENVRFEVGEKANDTALSKKIASLCDVFVMDAFATAHRAESSTCGVTAFASIACAGPLLAQEVESISKAVAKPKKPVVVIVGGSKVSTKLKLLKSVVNFSDYLIVGGGIANTFIAAQGHGVGKSLYEEDYMDEAASLIMLAKELGHEIIVPTDVMVSTHMDGSAEVSDRDVAADLCVIGDDERILDIGADTAKHIRHVIQKAGTIIWNGPLGMFEIDKFGRGTEILAKEIARSEAYSLAGGGDTIAAIEKYGVADDIDYISTGGGAFLEMLEGKKLPAVQALELRNK